MFKDSNELHYHVQGPCTRWITIVLVRSSLFPFYELATDCDNAFSIKALCLKHQVWYEENHERENHE